jgi:hypothetical protein
MRRDQSIPHINSNSSGEYGDISDKGESKTDIGGRPASRPEVTIGYFQSINLTRYNMLS